MGGPYAPKIHALGSPPTPIPDTPISAVFLALFIGGAITHMSLLIHNKNRGHKFLFSGALFGFCMARITANCLRIAWVYYPKNVRLAIAEGVFVAAGVVIIFIVNLFFVQRIIRARHPKLGWHPITGHALITFGVVVTILSIAMLIVAIIQQSYSLNPNTHRIDRDIQLYGTTWFAIVAFVPIPLLVLALVIPQKTPTEQFGSGNHHTKILIVMLGSALLTLGAAFRCGTTWLNPVPITEPTPWYFKKVCFYIFDFTVEVLVVYLYALVRVDRRFHVPDGSKGTYLRDYRTMTKSEEDGSEA